MNLRVLIPIAEGFEEMEAVTCIDILRRAGCTVVVAGIGPSPVRASRGLRVVPDADWETARSEPWDLVVLPGGAAGVQALSASTTLRAFLLDRHRRRQRIAAICAAPGLLAELGMLEGRRVTAFPGVLDPHSPHYQWVDQAVVVDGSLVTSQGPGTALDFALTLVEILVGAQRRQEVEAPLQRPSKSPR
ncbi:DJ-1 family glyoxalase III [Acidithiobacillus sp.]|uniref:DJ-1 family glyoxalase III n=1 Tax=Acidithiobacillus sp. TaxID=1872118 RepID=UPI0025BCD772|nr:DJ-1 family glyoxalase III [Acidithiobacillus sp.]